MTRCCNAPMFGGSYQVEDRGTKGLTYGSRSAKTSRCCHAPMFGGSYQVQDRAICVSPIAEANSQQQQDRAIAEDITGGMNTFSFRMRILPSHIVAVKNMRHIMCRMIHHGYCLE